MAEKKKVSNLNEEYIPPSEEFVDRVILTDKLDKAMMEYTLDLIEEAQKVNANEKHKLTAEITKLYAVIKDVPVVDGLQAQS